MNIYLCVYLSVYLSIYLSIYLFTLSPAISAPRGGASPGGDANAVQVGAETLEGWD